MKQVRHSVFETNSSSTHSISIVKGVEVYDTLPLFDGPNGNYVSIDQGEFGWGYEELTDAGSKAAYLWTFAKGGTDSQRKMLKEAILEHTGADEVQFDEDSEGYIDHQSSDVAEPVFESKQRIIDFIFNPKSVLILDTDNR